MEQGSPKASNFKLDPKFSIRPQSAKFKKKHKDGEADVPTLNLDDKPKRPWSAHPKSRSELSPKRIVRQTLKKPHLQAPFRELPPQEGEGQTEECTTVMNMPGLGITSQQYNLPTTDRGPENVRLDAGILHTLVGDARQSVEETPKGGYSVRKVKDEEEENKPPPSQRSMKRHPSFETWIEGSPHDSDEYDTDLEDDANKMTANVKKDDEKKATRKAEIKMATKKKEKLSDPTGKSVYEEQCKKSGVVPVSYLSRHLGDRNLRMRHHYLGGEGSKPVASALTFNTVTENLDLGDNYLQSLGAMYIARMLKENTFIVSLDISNNFIGTDGARAMADMLEVNTTLKTLSLAGNQLKDMDAKFFIDALKSNISLTTLDMSNNDFGERAGIYIGSALAVNDTLVDFDISWNAISGKGAVAMSDAILKNNTLEVLDLSWNGFGKKGCDALQTALKTNTKLRVLDLSNNRIGREAAKSLATGISKNFGLETVLMNLNPLGDEGMASILQAVELQQSLKYVSLEEMNISQDNYKKIQELESLRNISIQHGGMGGYKRYSSQASVLRILSRFLREHSSQIKEACSFQDKDKSGVLSNDEMKLALRDAGLKLTNKQMNLLIDDIDTKHTGSIKYDYILSGQALCEYYNRKPSKELTTASTYESAPPAVTVYRKRQQLV